MLNIQLIIAFIILRSGADHFVISALAKRKNQIGITIP